MFIPYRVDVPFDNLPVMNWLVFAGVIFVFSLQVLDFVTRLHEQILLEQEPARQTTNGQIDGRDGQRTDSPGHEPPAQPFHDGTDGQADPSAENGRQDAQDVRKEPRRGITDRLILDGWRYYQAKA